MQKEESKYKKKPKRRELSLCFQYSSFVVVEAELSREEGGIEENGMVRKYFMD